MVTVEPTARFQKALANLDGSLKEKVQKQILKIIYAPETGKPMMYARKGTREVYVPPFRISYAYIAEEDRIFLLDLYHKGEQ